LAPLRRQSQSIQFLVSAQPAPTAEDAFIK
jgi:hypothetical protein